MKIYRIFVVAGEMLLFGSLVFAQSAASSTAQTNPPKTIGQHKENQQDRIAQGLQSGQLTTGETKNLESRQVSLNREIRTDRSADGGKLTSNEKAQVSRQQNRLSKQIYNDKHNSAIQHYGNSKVAERGENQQDRIAQGIKSGGLTAAEAAHAENREQRINQQTYADRQGNGGKLTSSERRQINREQNAASRAIYNKKHNGQRQ